MPIYEYRCDDCGTEFEKRVNRFSDSGGVRCPSCGENHLTLRLSTFATHAPAGRDATLAPSCPAGMCRTPELCGWKQ